MCFFVKGESSDTNPKVVLKQNLSGFSFLSCRIPSMCVFLGHNSLGKRVHNCLLWVFVC